MSLEAEARERLKERAAEMIEKSRERLARAVGRQIQATVPKYNDIDVDALSGNLNTILRCVGPLLKGDPGKLIPVIETIAQLRTAAGFQASEFVLAGICFMPVLRRFFWAKADTHEEGIALYEVVEAVILPFLGRTMGIFINAHVEETAPEGISTEKFLEMLTDTGSGSSPFLPIEIASIDDSDEETITQRVRIK